MPIGQHDLSFLLSPMETGEFFSRYREKEPLVLKGDGPERYSSLLQTPDLDYIISGACQPGSQAIELLGDPQLTGDFNSRDADRVAAVYEAYGHGATIRIVGAQLFSKPLYLLCRLLEQDFSFPVRANLYVTPASSHGLNRYFDTHDVVVLQLSGSKGWRILEPVTRLPLPDTPPLIFKENELDAEHLNVLAEKEQADSGVEESEAHAREVTLEAGDLLYLPRGFSADFRREGEPVCVSVCPSGFY